MIDRAGLEALRAGELYPLFVPKEAPESNLACCMDKPSNVLRGIDLELGELPLCHEGSAPSLSRSVVFFIILPFTFLRLRQD